MSRQKTGVAMAKAIDITGQRFGRLVAVGVHSHKRGAGVQWLCDCDCGNHIVVETEKLRSGNTTSCGCRRVKEEIGNRYGRVVVIAKGSKPTGQGAMWLCRCDCGKEFVTRGSALRKGDTQSCGCVAVEKLRAAVMLPEGIAARNQTLRRLKANAAERGIEWELTDAQALEIMRQNCHYCGGGFSNLSSHPDFNGNFAYNGIDRVDNTKGYVTGNIVPCCKHCNIAKRDRTVGEFLEWIERVYQYSCLCKQEQECSV